MEVGHWRLGQTRYRVTTYRSPTVVVPRIFEIPGRSERVAVLSFTGIPYEGGYECQVPVLVAPACGDPIAVEWKGYGE